MKKAIILAGLIPFALQAQAFTEKSSALKNYYYGASSVQDVNNDGVADIFISGAIDPNNGASPSITYNQLYLVSGGTLIDSYNLDGIGVHGGGIGVFDFNNDGNKDVVTSGINYSHGFKHYRFTNTGNGFNDILDEDGRVSSDIEAFDFNHDGRLDYAVSGQDAQGQNIVYYQNTPSGFAPSVHLLNAGTTSGNFKVTDINNDQLLDLILVGIDANGNKISKTFLNTNGVLTEKQNFTGIAGRMDIADFNADGYIDFVAVGTDNASSPFFAYYMNDGTGNFIENILPNEGVDSSFVHCGDFNNDGYPDVAILGDIDFEPKTEIHYFTPSPQGFTKETQNGIRPVGGPGFINSLDINGDNKLDLVVSGFDWNAPDYPTITKLYENTNANTNQAPTPPTSLNATRTASGIEFSWSGATDDKTPVLGLSYELSVGTSQGASDIAKYEVKTPKWHLNLPQSPNEIHWQVKAIDASRVYSQPSVSQAFLSTLDSTKASNDIKLYPNPTTDFFQLSGVHQNDVESVMVFASNGALIRNFEKNTRYNITDLPKGVYLIKVVYKNTQSSVEKLIKR